MNSTIALKLYAFGINLLHDPNWTGLKLFYNIKDCYRIGGDAINLFRKTIKNGVLFQIGKWTFDEYFLDEHRFGDTLKLKPEYLLWYIEDFLTLLAETNIDTQNSIIIELYNKINYINSLYDKDESEYFDYLSKEKRYLTRKAYSLSKKFKDEIQSVQNIYSEEFANRAFHDRMLCEYISKLLIEIGFHRKCDQENYSKWIDREYLPRWAIKSVLARDRGICSKCKKNVTSELEDNYHIDHIIPLSKSGTNDLVNLQLLCAKCNSEKSNKSIPVISSIPKYITKVKNN